jgi:hypothetical protein
MRLPDMPPCHRRTRPQDLEQAKSGLKSRIKRNHFVLTAKSHCVADALSYAYKAGQAAARKPYKSAIRQLLATVDDLIAAIEGTTDQFEPEVMCLQAAATKAEQILKGGAA